MSTKNNNFQWRPNDNSPQTNLRYDLEMNHWLKSYKSATVGSTNTSFRSVFGVVMQIFSLIVSVILFVLICISDLTVWITNKIKKTKQKKIDDKRWDAPCPSKGLTVERYNELLPTRRVYIDDSY